MFSCSRLGREVRLVSLTLVESPATATALLSLQLSRSDPSLAYGFKLHPDVVAGAEKDPALTNAPLRYRLVGMPPFVSAASQTMAALFPQSRVSDRTAVYLSAVNGCTAADTKGMLRALTEGKYHAVQLTVEAGPITKRELEAVGLAKQNEKRGLNAQPKWQGRKSGRKAPAEAAEEEPVATNTVTPNDIDDGVAKVKKEFFPNPDLNTDTSAHANGELSVTGSRKNRRGRPPKHQSAQRGADAEENTPAEMSSKVAVGSHETPSEANPIDTKGDTSTSNPLIDSTAAVTQLIQRLSTLIPPSVDASVENSKGKGRPKKKVIMQLTNEDEAWLGKLRSKNGETKKNDTARESGADYSKAAKPLQSPTTVKNDDGVGFGGGLSSSSFELHSAKGFALASDAEGLGGDEIVTMEL